MTDEETFDEWRTARARAEAAERARMAWVDGLGKGDPVAYLERIGASPRAITCVVERVTTTRLVTTSGCAFYRNTGRRVGDRSTTLEKLDNPAILAAMYRETGERLLADITREADRIRRRLGDPDLGFAEKIRDLGAEAHLAMTGLLAGIDSQRETRLTDG